LRHNRRSGSQAADDAWRNERGPRIHARAIYLTSRYKPEHAVDLDTGVIVAAPIHGPDEGDTVTLDPTLAAVEKNSL
jgi:transposase